MACERTSFCTCSRSESEEITARLNGLGAFLSHMVPLHGQPVESGSPKVELPAEIETARYQAVQSAFEAVRGIACSTLREFGID